MTRYLLLVCLLILMMGCSSVGLPRHESPARDLLTENYHSKLLVEVITVGSKPPTSWALDYLKQKIERYCHKQNVVFFVNDPIPYNVAPTLIWKYENLCKIERYTSRFRTTGDTLVIKILYLQGVYAESADTRGLAFGDYSFAIFRNNFAADHERSVLLHELGHLLGLVNCGTPTTSDHAEPDPAHKSHCRNENQKCVMFWSSPSIPEPDFDPACKQDLVANGGKE